MEFKPALSVHQNGREVYCSEECRKLDSFSSPTRRQGAGSRPACGTSWISVPILNHPFESGRKQMMPSSPIAHLNGSTYLPTAVQLASGALVTLNAIIETPLKRRQVNVR